MASRWVKLNTNWMDSEWLIILSAESRLAWVQLLCYVKSAGIRGEVKAKTPMVFARQNFLGEESVEQMIRAAKANGALAQDGDTWRITNWKKHQGDETNAERQQRYRERKGPGKASPEGLAGSNEGDSNGSNALRNTGNAEERRGEEKREEPQTPKGDLTWKKVRDAFAAQMPESHHKPITEFCDYHRDLKTKPWTEETIRKRSEAWGAWPAYRFKAAVDHTILKGWKGLAEPVRPAGQSTSAPRRRVEG